MTEKDQIDRLFMRHSIIGVDQPVQGAAQTIPEALVLCLTCGWQRVSDYHYHLTDLVRSLRCGCCQGRCTCGGKRVIPPGS